MRFKLLLAIILFASNVQAQDTLRTSIDCDQVPKRIMEMFESSYKLRGQCFYYTDSTGIHHLTKIGKGDILVSVTYLNTDHLAEEIIGGTMKGIPKEIKSKIKDGLKSRDGYEFKQTNLLSIPGEEPYYIVHLEKGKLIEKFKLDLSGNELNIKSSN